MSRAFGDFSFKKETIGTDIVTVDPEVNIDRASMLILEN